MKKHALIVAASLFAVHGTASAEDWTGVEAVPPSYSNPPLPGTLHPVGALEGTEVIEAQCLAQAIGNTGGPVHAFYCDPPGEAGQRWVRISEFARSATVSALQAQVDALSIDASRIDSLEARIALIEAIPSIRNHLRRADAGIAMTTSLQPVAPLDGESNRLGFDVVTFNGQTALGAQYVRKEGQLDFNLGLATSGEETMARGGIGFSW